MGVLLGITSAISWGFADFFGGFASRRMSAAAVAFVSQVVGTALIGAIVLVARPPLPPWEDLGLGLLAGFAGGVGVYAFYRALAVGTMSLVAPISALSAGVPFTVGLIRGEEPSVVALTGALVALGGAVLASRAPGRASRHGLSLSVVAALGFGLFFVLIEPAADTSVLWAALSTRVTSVPTLLAVCLTARVASLRVGRGLWRFVIGAGVLDVAANVAYAAATQQGLLSIVAVLSGLYPVATVILAQVVLHERLSRPQAAGVMAALAGVGLIALG
jgi:drug/metabolite transporter (DMT)-like permease